MMRRILSHAVFLPRCACLSNAQAKGKLQIQHLDRKAQS